MSHRLAKATLLFPIFGSHVKRIGLVRTLAGSLPMYLCIPMLVIIHFSTAVFSYQYIFAPLLRLKRVDWRNHIIIDRYRIQGLSFFDKFNCMFCGYANGLTTMMNKELDILSNFHQKIPWHTKILLFFLTIPHIALMIFAELSFQIIYNLLVSTPLGLHRVSIKEARHTLRHHHYAAHYRPLPRKLIRAYKNSWLRFSLALEQIESAWCPLNHYEKHAGIVYPKHHKYFFGPTELAKMQEVLSTVGTVSHRTPLY